MANFPVKTRFAPSPTGYIHLGNLRAAFFSVLFAKAHQGTFLLRIEDTDAERSQTHYVDALLEDLRFLGLQADEGPYHQSTRLEVYNHYYDVLLSQDAAYPCYCSETQLEIQRKILLSGGKAPRYLGTCARLSLEERAQKEAQGLKPVLRFRMPHESIAFEDGVQGLKQFQGEDIGDFVIRRADGTPTFMYCNAIDDSMMGVTHVIRGEDHLTNTPRQLAILKALGLHAPHYAHLPMIVGHDGKPLSKRNGSEAIRVMREKGYFKEAILNHLARLGHPFEENTCYSLEALATHFDLSKFSRSPSHFDMEQLHYWQKQVLMQQPLEELKRWLTEALGEQVTGWDEAFIEAIRGNILFPEDAKAWHDLCFGTPQWDEGAWALLKGLPEAYWEAFEGAVDEKLGYDAAIERLKATGLSGKALFMPLRVVLTGTSSGPDIKALWPLLGPKMLKKKAEAFKQRLAQLKS